jgi:hypothetical protein
MSYHASGTSGLIIPTHTQRHLAVGDQVVLATYHNSGADTVTATAGVAYTALSVAMIQGD